MRIEGKRIYLRPWKDEDLDILVESLNNLNISKWMASIPYPYTREDGISFIKYSKEVENSGKDLMLAIVLKDEDVVIGGLSIHDINKKDGIAGGGIWLNENFQKNGYGTEAFSLRAKYCFEELGLRRLENGFFVGNEKSLKMQEKLGYKHEGIRRKRFLCLATGQYMDECITGLLKEEFIEYNGDYNG